MTHDEGFAPNPFFGFLSLATCKPQIRNIAQPGDWVAGWGARFLCGRGRNHESLVYLAQVKEVMTMADYWTAHLEKRVPKAFLGRTDEPQCLGDNIYQPNGQNGYIQQLNNNHYIYDAPRDLRSKNVILCDTFYYFPVVKDNGKVISDLSLDIADSMRIVSNMSVGLRYSYDETKNNDLIALAKNEFELRLKDSGCKTREDYILSIRFPNGFGNNRKGSSCSKKKSSCSILGK